MSESGSTHFSRIPSFLEVRQAALAEAKAEARIEELPKELLNNDKPLTLRGKIAEQNQDGTIRIKTDRGDVVLKLGKNADFPINREIEIRIPKGSPPEQATLRPAQPKNQMQTPAVENTIQKNVNIPAPVPASEIKPGTIIKVIALPPTVLDKLIAPYTDTEVSALPIVLPTLFTIPDIIKEKLQEIFQPLLYSPDIITGIEPFSAPATPQIEKISSGMHSHIIEKPFFSENNPATFNSITEIPALKSPALSLRTIISQILAAPLQSPIQDAMTLPVAEISEIKIQSIQMNFESFSNFYTERQQGLESTPDLLTNIPDEKQAGVVIGFTPDRHFPVLQIAQPASSVQDQYYVLEYPITNLPVGTRIEFTAPAAEQMASAPTENSFIPSLSMAGIMASVLPMDNWETLEEIQKILVQNAPQAAHTLANTIPNANAPARILPAALFFIAAMRSGDIQNWLGDKAVDAVKRAGKSDLLSRLSGETSFPSRSENSSQDWRTTVFPLSWQNEIHKISLHYRKEGSGGDNQNDDKGGKTRFIMDLSLSNIGKIQIDGLFQGNINSSARLDVILRTTQSFSQTMRMQMRQIYKNALDETKITGNLDFQDQISQWVRIYSSSNAVFSENI